MVEAKCRDQWPGQNDSDLDQKICWVQLPAVLTTVQTCVQGLTKFQTCYYSSLYIINKSDVHRWKPLYIHKLHSLALPPPRLLPNIAYRSGLAPSCSINSYGNNGTVAGQKYYFHIALNNLTLPTVERKNALKLFTAAFSRTAASACGWTIRLIPRSVPW